VSDILKTWITALFPKTILDENYFIKILGGVIKNGKIDFPLWERCNLIHIFTYCSNKLENYMIFSEDLNVFHLTQNPDEFKSLIDKGFVKKSKDQYFRLNQSERKCGLYFEVCNP
jgi:hypothetical protein